MLTYSEAIARILATVQALPPVEVPLSEAGGSVLATRVSTAWNLPPADNAAMDGYAFACAGLQAGSSLFVQGEVRAGAVHAGEVPSGVAVKIMTGAALPQGCDTVVAVEDVTQDGDMIMLREAPEKGDHVRYRGEEFSVGAELLPAGMLLRAAEIALLAAGGVTRVSVHRPPRVSLLCTGDELVELGDVPGPGQIVNSNLHLIAERLREEGYVVASRATARDRREELLPALKAGLKTDLLITTGGVSAGAYDLVQPLLEELGFKRIFWKVAIKPGKPVLFGVVGTTPVIGLPGNPAAAAATFQLFTLPVLRLLAGRNDPLPTRLPARLVAPVKGQGSRQGFLWGQLEYAAGEYLFRPSSRQGSGQNRSLQGAQALLPVAADSPPLAAGAGVEVLLIYPPPGAAGR